jgi:hypothetical protein
MRHAAIIGRTASGEQKLVAFGPASEVHRRYKSATVADKDLEGCTDILIVPSIKAGRRRSLSQPVAQVAPPAPVAEVKLPEGESTPAPVLETADVEESAPAPLRRRRAHPH